jgi:hypothetical protein
MAFESANTQDAENSMIWRDDPIDEPWHELDFRMTSWQYPSGLPDALLEDLSECKNTNRRTPV